MQIQPGEVAPSCTGDAGFGQLIAELEVIRADMVASQQSAADAIALVHPNQRSSAANLCHYLALRRRDLRALQVHLAERGLSSLGRAEGHALATVDAVLELLNCLTGRQAYSRRLPESPTFCEGEQLLVGHAEALLGTPAAGREVRIMVTMPSEAADEPELIVELLRNGMDCMRINCAHDDIDIWGRMIAHLRSAEKTLGRQCRVTMDLAGPKLRTAHIAPDPAALRISPKRDGYGRVLRAARIRLVERAPSEVPHGDEIEVRVEPLPRPQEGQSLRLTDARGVRKKLKVIVTDSNSVLLEAQSTVYLTPGILITQAARESADVVRSVVSDFARAEGCITLRSGEILRVARAAVPGSTAVRDSTGEVIEPATIGVTLPEALAHAQSGQPIWFDDGKIGGVIEAVDANWIEVRITHARESGSKLRADKGINLPETHIELPALTEKDLTDLEFAARHADVIALSFVNRPEDVELIQYHLSRIGSTAGLVLKIETQSGFDHLPQILLTAMRSAHFGVMIARGDLAIECGFERLAEVQEEILWLCEAGHVPVIWATQVLESLAKKGQASRAEISDAAMSDRAECVMLNKGPHVVEAVRMLDDILRRMQAHQNKKTARLRELKLARGTLTQHCKSQA